MLDSWPSGMRDTTAFPDVEIEVKLDLREHLQATLSFDGIGAKDYDAQRDRSHLNITDERLRTYRKMYERLGLIRVVDERMQLTPLGRGFCNLVPSLEGARAKTFDELRKRAVAILSRYQFMNPTEDTRDLPSDCDVRPCICIWKAMRELDNKIHFEEMNRVILRIMRMQDLGEGIAKIKLARKSLANYSDFDEQSKINELGAPVHTDQSSARIASWFSFAGWGGLLISRNGDDMGFRNFIADALPIVEEILLKSLPFFTTNDEKEWWNYYLADFESVHTGYSMKSLSGLGAVNSLICRIECLGGHYKPELVRRFHAGLNALEAKHFVILSGVSGTGKTGLVKRYAFAVHGITDLSSSDPLFFMVAVRPDWTDPAGLTGYKDVITQSYIVPQFLKAVHTANNNPHSPVFVCLDEMNIARVEYYFADVLSSMETGGPLELHEQAQAIDSSLGPLAPQIPWPHNLFIVGTINIDESTHAISPKVLDRAFVIDMSDIDVPGYLGKLSEDERLTASVERCRELLQQLHDALFPYRLSFGYRTIKEVVSYHAQAAASTDVDSEQVGTLAIDDQLVQKIFTKLRGTTSHQQMLADLVKLVENYAQASEMLRSLQKDLSEFGSFQASR